MLCKPAFDTIRDLESNLHIKQENVDVKENNLETEIENKSYEISNLCDLNKQLQNQSETLEASWQEHKIEIQDIHKLGLSWAKLSCQLGVGCTVINIILINMK